MSSPEERRDARYDVPLGVPDPDAEPARRNGHRRVTAPAARPAAPPDEPDTSADEPGVPGPATPHQPAKKTVAKKTVAKKAVAKKTVAKKAVAQQATADEAPAGKAPAGDTPPGPSVADRPGDHWDRKVAQGLAFLRRRLAGDYEVDEFGFDPDLTDAVVHPLVRLLYRDWFRTEVSGIEHVPDEGAGLVVGNHSGTVAIDALILSTALHDRHPAHRYLRLLGADLVFRMPVVSEIARKTGGTVACNPDAERLLGNGELVGVFPEGFKGVGKLYADRYKLQRFGRGGFVSAALRTGTPIVPVAIVGGEEIYPMLADIKPLARLLKLPYFPVTPTFPWLGPLGMVPLPSKWLIEFCPPIPTAHLRDAADDPLVVFNLADQVRETIQQTLHKLLERRPDPFGP
ncbi:1-acyl-sn-glycerol-3-phosphate acyltransferase [Micromonospora tulbaghiae]|uniref:1-acyl-sn-glycerol-3-phosphate acyltransferase n=1 Tax=Micromonospora tulbaghiae TaxID=479978 RepID=A0ABY0KT82_9ACTN|nr:1-acyl-sn-glycerol-3-phosphate acyltransferase [Micromonospora tulbaghiae]